MRQGRFALTGIGATLREIICLRGLHRVAQCDVVRAAGSLVSGFHDRLSADQDFDGAAVKLFLADRGTHFRDERCGEFWMRREASR